MQTVDFFPPIVDDPFLFGQIAAANALSDVYAMGGEPKLAMNVMCINSQMGKEAVRAILQGGYDKAYEAGVLITGGHTIEDKEPKYGLSVTGFVHPQKLLRNSSAREGDVLILTKPLGVGILMTAAQGDMVEEGLLRKLYDTFPALEKVTTYAGPRSTLAKSPEELKAIREAGLNRAYLGVESGSDAVLKAINKGVTAAQMLEAGQKLVAAGFDLWAIIIMGLTGQEGDWEEHILSTAKMINEMKPRHLSAMTFAPAKGTPLGEDVLAGRFKVCTPDQILEECHLLIEHLDVDPLHFTSNHASNYLPLKGGLPEDREKFLGLLDEALAGKIRLRKTLNRGI